jgi:hypothetical protein
MGDGCPPSETSAPTSPWFEMALTVEACHRLDLKRLFRSGRIGPGSTGSWREQRWRIDGPFLVMWGKRWRLVPAPRRNVRGVQWLLLVATGRRCTCLFMTPNGKVGTRWELELRYKSETLWMGKRLAHRRHKVIEKLDVPTDFKWVRDHPTYAPNTPKRTRWKTFRRLRKRLVTWRKQPELDDLKSLMGQLTRA